MGKVKSLSDGVVMCYLLLRPLGVVSQVPQLRRLQLCFTEDFFNSRLGNPRLSWR
jgi:hypothetical protein